MHFIKNYAKSLLYPYICLPILYLFNQFGWFLDRELDMQFGRLFTELYEAYQSYLPLLLAASFSMFFAKRKDGTSVLSGIIAYVVLIHIVANDTLALALPNDTSILAFDFTSFQNPFVGIVSGMFAAQIYNRFYQVQLPQALAFFSGRRLVPIVTGIVMIVFGCVLILIWPWLYQLLESASQLAKLTSPFGSILYMWLQTLLSFVGLQDVAMQEGIQVFTEGQEQAFRVLIPAIIAVFYISKFQANVKQSGLLFIMVGLGAIGPSNPVLFTYLLLAIHPLYVLVFYGLQSVLLLWQVSLVPNDVLFVVISLVLHVACFWYLRNRIPMQLNAKMLQSLSKQDISNFVYAIGGIENIVTLHIADEKLYIVLEDEILLRKQEIDNLPKYIRTQVMDNELIVEGISPKVLYDALDAHIKQDDESLMILGG
ncbi:hypothetical protein A4S06_01390 [Erysipelotrichaceae bacterium MTC7]|nr:hypothetical protein A4S06_01390 [Erysipelotrichaceae bacterium MTC7]